MTASFDTLRRDPLLAAARLGCTLGMALSGLVFGTGLIAIPTVLAFPAMLDRVSGAQAFIRTPGLVVAVLLAIAAMAGSAFAFLRLLRRIVISVGQRDPFAPVNARRLALMGWLALGIELLAGLVALLGHGANPVMHDATLDFTIDPGGILLAIVLFVLARVFREGARMRDDLAGTV